MGACLLGSTCAALLFARALRAGSGVRAAWLGLLLFSSSRLVVHLLQLPRLQRSLAARSAHGSAGGDGAQHTGEASER